MADISEFKSQLLGGGARPSQFRVELSFPSWVSGGTLAGQQSQFLCKSAQLPGSIITDIPTFYRGRVVHLAGEREFQPWTISIYNDTNFNIRNAFENWSDGITAYGAIQGRTNPTEYQVDMFVHQLDRGGAIIKSYKFFDAYPVDIGIIQLDFEATNTIETFDVTFQYNFFEPR